MLFKIRRQVYCRLNMKGSKKLTANIYLMKTQLKSCVDNYMVQWLLL